MTQLYGTVHHTTKKQNCRTYVFHRVSSAMAMSTADPVSSPMKLDAPFQLYCPTVPLVQLPWLYWELLLYSCRVSWAA